MKIQDYRLLIKKKLEYKDVYVEELDFEEHERLDKVIDVAFALYDVVGQSEQLFCGVKDGFCPYEESDMKCMAEHKCINQVAK